MSLFSSLSLPSLKLLLGLGLCSLTAWSTAATDTTKKTVETTLNNSLKVIVLEDHRAPMVMSHIWYKVGSTDESGHTLGISHVLEHMMFKGTHKVPNDEFTRLSRVYGGRINAATFTNYTNYYQLYPKAYFPLALELEADRMSNLLLRQQDFEPEVRVVMEERRQRTDDNPRAVAFEKFKWISYPTSHYRQPIIGHMKSLQSIRLSDVQDWYKKWYTPNNAILVIVGDIQADEAILQVQKYFGDIPSRALPIRNDVEEFTHVGYRHVEMEAAVQVPNLYMTWNVKSIATAEQPNDAYTLTIIRSLLDSGINSRLQKNLVHDQKILSSVSVSYDPYNRGDSLFGISALPNSGISLEQAKVAIEKEIEAIKNEPVKQAEIDRIATRFVSNMVYSQDDISNQAKLIGNLEVNGLSYRLLDELPEHFRKIRPSDVQRVAQYYFVKNNLSTLYLSPVKKVS